MEILTSFNLVINLVINFYYLTHQNFIYSYEFILHQLLIMQLNYDFMILIM